MCSKLEVWQGARSHLSLRCVPTEFPSLNLLYFTKLPGMVLRPTAGQSEIKANLGDLLAAWRWVGGGGLAQKDTCC